VAIIETLGGVRAAWSGQGKAPAPFGNSKYMSVGSLCVSSTKVEMTKGGGGGDVDADSGEELGQCAP